MREVEALRRRISVLSAASLRISASIDLDTVLHEVVDSARALTGSGYGLIITLDSFAILDDVAYRISDNAAADALQQARRTLFTTINEQEQKRA